MSPSLLLSSLFILRMLHSVHSKSIFCCDEDYTVSLNDNVFSCDDGRRNISLQCQEGTHVLDPARSKIERFAIEPDSRYLMGYYFIVTNTTQYCLGAYELDDEAPHNIAIVCSDAFEILTDNDLKWLYYTKPIQILSCLFLLLTAVVYYMVDQLKRDIQGVCIFHFSLLMSANYLFMALPMDFSSLLPSHLCITHSYVTCFCILSGFMWMHILSYNMWKSSKGCIFDMEYEIRKYKTICYTAPLIMILIPLVSLYVNGVFFDEEITCRAHQRWLLGVYVGLPVLITMAINVFFFADTSRRLWKFYKQQAQPSAIKGLRYRFGLYIKLFLITGLPWFVFFIASSFEDNVNVRYIIISLIAYSQGIFIFIIMVICRKRARRGLAAQKIMGRHIFPQNWVNITDGEETEEEPQFDAATARQENNHQNHV